MPEPFPPELCDLLALRLVDGLGPARIAALIERFGSAAGARTATAAQLRDTPGFGGPLAEKVAAQLASVDPAAEAERLTRAGVEALALGHGGYPDALVHIPAAPRLLFLKGTLLAEDARAVALVGTRHPDPYGKRVARSLGEGLARAGVTVVSGLARGIDGISHQAALDAGGRTLAVLAGGLSRIYPPEHAGLADRVADAGALVTEATMLEGPTKGHFPARNRIISGLSRVVVIVQAPTDSGALITAEHAAEQGRTVLAVPGLVGEAHNAGCHRLLREGAVLCRGVDDVLEELDGASAVAVRQKKNAAPPPQSGPPPGLDDTQRRVWDFLGDGPRGGDEIARHAGLAVAQLSNVLMMLEIKKAVRRLPGNRYERGG
ncbi:MAG: DNA-processing protein DprA [Gemmataceae bacterium]